MSTVILFLLVASASCVSIRKAHSVYNSDWEAYKIVYKREYQSLEDEAKRRLIWEDNLAYISKHNLEAARGLHSFTLGLGPFTDLTNQEFRETTTCFNHDVMKLKATELKYTTPASDSIDWRTKGVVTRVKNQEQCGSCYAFATAATIESRQAISRNRAPQDLSAQQIVDCDMKEGGCNGGWPYRVMSKYLLEYSLMTWDTYPYIGKQQYCVYQRKYVGAQISNPGVIERDEEQMRLQVGSNGPIAVALNAHMQSFQHYKSGVYDDVSCPNSTTHAVTVVGYGNEEGKDFWLLKNSWGVWWGDKGYLKMARNKNRCGVNTQAAYCDAY